MPTKQASFRLYNSMPTNCQSSQVKSSLYINNRQPHGSLSNVLNGGQQCQWWKGVGGDDGDDGW